MRHVLTCHPDTPCTAASGIAVEVERPAPAQLLLRYRIGGVNDRWVSPSPFPAVRTDGLWRHTCFEAFVRPLPGEAYRELNFATGAWASYRFDSYRAGMADADIGAPDIHISGPGGGIFDMLVIWDLDLPGDAEWRVGVSMVVEETGGRMSYWALAHPPGKPDFHHADCFALQLPPPDRP